MRGLETFVLTNPLRAFIQRRFEAPRLFGAIPPCPGGRCLEIGCGQGAGILLTARYIGCGRVIAIDIDPRMVARARDYVRRPHRWMGAVPAAEISFAVMDAVSLAVRDEFLDRIAHFFVFEHITRWRTVIAEGFRALRPGGIWVFEEGFVPDSPLFLNRFFGHVPIRAGELRTALLDAGFRLERFEGGRFRCFVTAVKPGRP